MIGDADNEKEKEARKKVVKHKTRLGCEGPLVMYSLLMQYHLRNRYDFYHASYCLSWETALHTALGASDAFTHFPFRNSFKKSLLNGCNLAGMIVLC